MTEVQRKPGRPKKYVADDFHFKSAESEQTIEHQEDSVVPDLSQLFSEGGVPAEAEEKPTYQESSLIEQKIQELVHASVEVEITNNDLGLNGWSRIDSEDHILVQPPRNGTSVRVSYTPNGIGIIAYWKKTRAFANPTRKWETTGVWCNFMTGTPLSSPPNYWKSR